MELVWMFLGILGLMALPVGIYWLRVRPRVEAAFMPLILAGICMAVAMLIPMVTMAALFMGVIWKVTMAALLVIHSLVWLCGAVKKRTPFLAGAVATGVTVAVSGALIGNWIALGVALIYLCVLIRCQYDFG